MTIKFSKVYIKDTSTIAGPYEKKGPLGKYFDKTYDDLYFGENTWEQAEMKMLNDGINILLNKVGKTTSEVNLFISGDLQNQITISNYAASYHDIPYLGIYSACAASCEGIIIASSLLSSNQIKNCICSVSSHNGAAEKQFRNPVEYGAPKPKVSTFTCTGSGNVFLNKETGKIRVESGTIGSAIDMGIKNVYHMCAVMAPAAADTIFKHLTKLNRDVSYYDLILTGDLGIYGKEILIDYMKREYNMDLSKNYDDCGVMLYDRDNQPVFAGASGPASSALVTYSYIFDRMKKGELKKVLLVATGALMSQTTVNQKLSIPSIAHAISLEVEE
jgi:stage V sporulation protein AD